MEVINIAELIQAGVHGVLVIILLFGWYERREMRKEQMDLLLLVMAAHPEAEHVVSQGVQRKLQAYVNKDNHR